MALIVLFLVASLLAGLPKAATFLGLWSIALIAIGTKVAPMVRKGLGDTAAEIFDAFLAMIFITLVLGYEVAPNRLKANPPTMVCTKSSVEIGAISLPLDRGIALIEGTGFRIIPWEDIRAVTTFDAPAAGKAPRRSASEICDQVRT